MRNRRPITISFNGAEYMELLARAKETSTSVPAYVLIACGVDTWRLAAAHDRPALPRRGRPVRFALERRSVTVTVTEQAYAELEARASAAGTTIPQYMRTQCGFAIRNMSLPGTCERDREEDDAWERLKRLGVNPQEYFPEEE
jgi:hypothetical protein